MTGVICVHCSYSCCEVLVKAMLNWNTGFTWCLPQTPQLKLYLAQAKQDIIKNHLKQGVT